MVGQNHKNRPLIFGEVLFDNFPDGSSVMGGAPFNVAWHLQGFGCQPLLISSVGKDTSGEKVLSKMNAWGMDVSGVQVDEQHPTGSVQIELVDGQPSFSILSDQAYDYIGSESIDQILKSVQPALLYHGSLAVRNRDSQQTLFYLQDKIDVPVFVDINLRPPWWEKSLLDALLKNATWAKLNEDELLEMSGNSSNGNVDYPSMAEQYREKKNLDMLILTLGAEGAHLISKDGMVHGEPVIVENIVDTVGAGDAFSSVILFGLLSGWSKQLVLPRALEFASSVCANRGAVINDRDVYQSFLDNWQS